MKIDTFDSHKEVDKLNKYFAEKGWTIKQTKEFLNFYLENVDSTQKIVKNSGIYSYSFSSEAFESEKTKVEKHIPDNFVKVGIDWRQ